MLHKNILQRIICLLIALSFVMLYIPVYAESEPEIIRVGYVANGSIFTFDEEGNVKGYETVLLDEIAKRNNWQYEYVGGTLDEIMEMLDNGQLDLVCHVKKNADREQKYLFSDFVAGIETGALCCRAEDGRFFYNDFSSFDGMRVAMLKGNYFNTKLAEFAEKSGFSYIPCQYDSYTECYDALKKGAADGIVIGALVVDPECRILSCFCSEPFYFITENSAMIANSDIDPRIISIINKAIQALDSERVNEIVLAHTGASPYVMTAEDIIYAYRYIIAIVLLVIVLLSAMVIIIAVNKHRNVKILTEKNMQLKDALLHAEDASKAKSSFLSKMSHEIRTPINAIAGFSAIARKHENDSEKVDDCLKKIDSNTKVLLNIVNDVLDMNSIENNRMKIDSAEFDLTRVIEEIRDIYEPQCNAKNVQFTVSADIPDELLMGDCLRVEQILMNLVSNAYKFTPSGGSIDFTVSEINRSGNDAYLRFAVADTGCGMSDDMLGRVFKPFEQESSNSAKKHTGSGLGLSIAKNLVDMMQGAISVRSQKGKGTTFTVDLPFGLTGKTGGEKNAINAPAVSEKQYDFTGYKVILAEDNEFNAEIARDLLELVNMGVDAAENGIEAVKLFESNPPLTYCCILMDLQMPEMGGLDAARKIRSLDRNDAGEIPIYAMTANTYAEDITASLSAGMNGHIAKPIDVDMLYRTLEKAIEGAAAPLNL